MIGLGIVILLVGVPSGLLMLLKPREVWHATEGWKFRNPEANEPSGVSLALSGLGVLVGSIFVALMVFTAPGDDTSSTSASSTRSTYVRPSSTYRYTPPPAAPFTAPAPQNRGSLTVFGYTVDQAGVATVYYYAPKSVPVDPKGEEATACDVVPRAEGLGTEDVVVGVELQWAPKQPSELPQNYSCRNDDTQELVSRALVVGPVSATARLSTRTPPNFPFPTAPLVRYATPPLGYSGV